MSDGLLAYLDTCAIIDFFERTPVDRYKAVLEIMERAKASEVTLITSTFSMVETYKIRSGKGAKEAENQISEFFTGGLVRLRNLDLRVARFAQIIQRTYPDKLWPKDAAHVATAVAWGIPIIITGDGSGKFKGRKRPMIAMDNMIPLGLESANPKIRIVRPQSYLQLFPAQSEFGPQNES